MLFFGSSYADAIEDQEGWYIALKNFWKQIVFYREAIAVFGRAMSLGRNINAVKCNNIYLQSAKVCVSLRWIQGYYTFVTPIPFFSKNSEFPPYHLDRIIIPQRPLKKYRLISIHSIPLKKLI
jgi:hypothetical protein